RSVFAAVDALERAVDLPQPCILLGTEPRQHVGALLLLGHLFPLDLTLGGDVVEPVFGVCAFAHEVVSGCEQRFLDALDCGAIRMCRMSVHGNRQAARDLGRADMRTLGPRPTCHQGSSLPRNRGGQEMRRPCVLSSPALCPRPDALHSRGGPTALSNRYGFRTSAKPVPIPNCKKSLCVFGGKSGSDTDFRKSESDPDFLRAWAALRRRRLRGGGPC